MQGWRRSMRWPQTERAWVATSPNIPTFEAALVYPGIGIVGEAEVSEGRGTPTPFSLFGAPWLDGPRMVARLNALGLPGVKFREGDLHAALDPGRGRASALRGDEPQWRAHRRHRCRAASSRSRSACTCCAAIAAEARSKGVAPLFANLKMLHAIAGTRRLHPHARRRQRRRRHHRRLASRGRAVQGPARAVPALLSLGSKVRPDGAMHSRGPIRHA